MHKALILPPAVLTLILSVGVCAAATPDLDEATGLVKGEHWEYVKHHCTACHSAMIITAQRTGREDWRGIIRWMQDTQNLWPIDEESLEKILDYLSKYYSQQTVYTRRAPLPARLMPSPP